MMAAVVTANKATIHDEQFSSAMVYVVALVVNVRHFEVTAVTCN